MIRFWNVGHIINFQHLLVYILVNFPSVSGATKTSGNRLKGLRRYCTAHYFLMCPIMDCILAIPRMLSPWLTWHHSQSALEWFNYKHQSFQECRLQNCIIKQLCWAGHVSRLEDHWLLKTLTSLQSGEVGLNSINLLFLKLTLASSLLQNIKEH